MNVEDLIEKLRIFDGDLEVVYTDNEYGYTDIRKVHQSTRVTYKDDPPGDRVVVLSEWQ